MERETALLREQIALLKEERQRERETLDAYSDKLEAGWGRERAVLERHIGTLEKLLEFEQKRASQ